MIDLSNGVLKLRIAFGHNFRYHGPFGAQGKLADFDPSQNFDLSIPYNRAFQKLQNVTFSFGNE